MSILEHVGRAFGSVPRPHNFLEDPEHCEECAEHNETLRSHTPETIGIRELGNGGWDPICSATTEAYLYYMPALARLALSTGEEWYLDQFLFHLSEDRVAAFNLEQRVAVLLLLGMNGLRM